MKKNRTYSKSRRPTLVDCYHCSANCCLSLPLEQLRMRRSDPAFIVTARELIVDEDSRPFI